jgi:putative ABC transport system substrate-binding protein
MAGLLSSLVLSWLALDSARAAAQAVVVLSSEAMPHRKAAAAYNGYLRQHGISITTVQFEALSDDLLATLLAEKPRVVTAIGTEAAVSLSRRLPADVPLTYCMVADSTAAGLTMRPGTAGVRVDVPLNEQFKIIAEALPGTRAVGMLYQPSSSRSNALVEQVRRELPVNWRLVAISLNDHGSVADAVSALFREKIDVVWTAADSAVYDTATVRTVLLTSLRHKVPVFGFSSGFVRAGALLGVSIDPSEQGEQCAQITAELLGEDLSPGTRDGERLLETRAPRFRVEVNQAVAEMIGVELPQGLVQRAHRVRKAE